MSDAVSIQRPCFFPWLRGLLSFAGRFSFLYFYSILLAWSITRKLWKLKPLFMIHPRLKPVAATVGLLNFMQRS
ncbi:uncharacterized protein BDW70DRAFT_127266 [Aspergillus foveolatus]|uniref:uncharacterized protein n=1 Tax=Aspergillus foveolatus TaxID=210207 RepID=UPI003CCDB13C